MSGNRRDPRLLAPLMTLVVGLLLQFQRQPYFLTDDNLSSVLGTLCDVGATLRAGRIPVSYGLLMGGGHSLFADPGMLYIWHPLHLAMAWLAAGGARFWAVDIICVANLMLAAGAMAALLQAATAREKLPAHPWIIVALSCSYAISGYTLLLGASWFNFLGNVAAMPLMAMAFYTRRFWTGSSLAAAGVLHALLGGHPSPLALSLVLLGLWALARLAARDPKPLLRLAVAGLVSAAISAPILLPYFGSLTASTRGAGFTVAMASERGVGFLWQWAGAIGSVLQTDFKPPAWGVASGVESPDGIVLLWGGGIAFLIALARIRRPRTEIVILLGMAGLTSLMIARPDWLQKILLLLPVLKSLRWPFREVYLLHFFLTLLTGLVLVGRARLPAVGLGLGLAVFCGRIALMPPPTLNLFPLDRALLLGGFSSDWWGALRPMLGAPATAKIVPTVSSSVLARGKWPILVSVPHSLAGGFNFPATLDQPSVSGYIVPGWDYCPLGIKPVSWSGYLPAEEIPDGIRNDPSYIITEAERVFPTVLRFDHAGRSCWIVFPDTGGLPYITWQRPAPGG